MTTETITIHGPAIVIHGFDSQAGRYVCQKFGIDQREEAEAFKKVTGPHFLMYSSFHKGVQTFHVTPDHVIPEVGRQAYNAALGHWFGNFDTAE